MWPDGNASSPPARLSTNSEVALVENGLAQALAQPPIGSVNVNKSKDVHVGTKIVKVTQHVHSNEVVKDYPFPQYLWSIIKNTTKTERATCVIAILLIVLCIVLITYFTVSAKIKEPIDVAPHEWNITREMWWARPFHFPDNETTHRYEPLRLVIVEHSASQECHSFTLCARELRTLQSWFLEDEEDDLPYNFIIGNDGRVYEGRGWGIIGAHTLGYNWCTLGIGFIGDYRPNSTMRTEVTQAQVNRTMMLLDAGVRMGYLDPNYVIVGAKDLKASESPGSNLYNVMKKWKHYDHQNRYYNKTCSEIYSMPLPNIIGNFSLS